MNNFKYCFIVLLLFYSEYIFAEDMQLLTVTTGTRTSKLISEAPIKTEVVTKEAIANTHAKNVSEALKYVPGVLIKETHGKQGSSVWIQGFDSDRVLILIDGEPMTSATGQTVDLSQLDVSDIESIEIIKGAASALYGSQAMGGVINIKTSSAKKGFHSTGVVELGTFGNKSAKEIPVTQLKTAISYRGDDYESSLFTDYRYESGVKLQEGYAYDLPQITQLNINAKFKTLGKHQFYIKPRVYISNSLKPYSTFAPGVGAIEEEKTEDVEKYRVSVGSNSDFNNGDRLKTSLFVERYISKSLQNKLLTSYVELTRKAIIDMSQADVQYDKAFGDSHIMTTGIQLRMQALEQEQIKTTATSSTSIAEVDNASNYALEAYIQDDWFIGDDLELIPGLRYQYDSDFGSYVSPKVSLFYTPYVQGKDRFNIRASYGNGYRAPSLKERYFTFDHSNLGYMVLGNPNLIPESSHSLQLSFEWIDASMFNINVNFFYNDITNLINTEKNNAKSIATGLEIHEYTNIGNALTYGTEIQTSKRFLKIWTLSGGYTYLHSEDSDTKKSLTQRPLHQVKATLSMDINKTTNAQVSAVYESEQYVDSANLFVSPAATQVDIKMTQQVTKLFSIYGGINNLLNEHENPSDPNDLRTKRPRYAYLAARYKF